MFLQLKSTFHGAMLSSPNCDVLLFKEKCPFAFFVWFLLLDFVTFFDVTKIVSRLTN